MRAVRAGLTALAFMALARMDAGAQTMLGVPSPPAASPAPQAPLAAPAPAPQVQRPTRGAAMPKADDDGDGTDGTDGGDVLGGGDGSTAAPPKPAFTASPAPPAPVWQPHGTALLQVLDKVTGKATMLTLQSGQSARLGTTSITARACFARPPDEPADATALVALQDDGATAPSFQGWLLAAEPAAAIVEHPVYDVRVVGCR